MEAKTVEQFRADMSKAFRDAHGYARHSRLPGLEHRRDASIKRMFMCREIGRNAIAQIRAMAIA